MIIVLAALQLTSNDVHSRLTRRRNTTNKVIKPIFRANGTDNTGSTPLETMQFANNGAVVTSLTSMGAAGAVRSQISSVFVGNGSLLREETFREDKSRVFV